MTQIQTDTSLSIGRTPMDRLNRITDDAKGMSGAIARAEAIAASDARFVLVQQFKNPAHPAIHEATTGPEFRDVTGGAVEPSASPVLTQTRRGDPIQAGPYRIQGSGAGFVPQVLDLSLLDAIEQVSNDEAVSTACRLAREEGILSGTSCVLPRLPGCVGRTSQRALARPSWWCCRTRARATSVRCCSRACPRRRTEHRFDARTHARLGVRSKRSMGE
jgi:8-oxo-dGTP pyrophosphatase MutT (NUDIX family)